MSKKDRKTKREIVSWWRRVLLVALEKSVIEISPCNVIQISPELDDAENEPKYSNRDYNEESWVEFVVGSSCISCECVVRHLVDYHYYVRKKLGRRESREQNSK